MNDQSITTWEVPDWTQWEPEVRANLLFVLDGDQILLIRKKRGLGAGKINGPGGKLDPGETAAEAAIRETREEVGLEVHAPVAYGELFFQFTDGLRLHCVVFRAENFSGEAIETDEATPLWTPVDAIPFDEMWADDRHWLPLLLEQRAFKAYFVFDDEIMLHKQIDLVALEEVDGQ